MSKLEDAITYARHCLERDSANIEQALQGLLGALVGVPGTPDHEIDEVWVWVLLDDQDGNEGIPAYRAGNTLYPMIGADADRAMQLSEIAQGVADFAHSPITLRRFTEMTIVDTLEPRAP